MNSIIREMHPMRTSKRASLVTFHLEKRTKSNGRIKYICSSILMDQRIAGIPLLSPTKICCQLYVKVNKAGSSEFFIAWFPRICEARRQKRIYKKYRGQIRRILRK
jgi:adenylylsulfate kinase-like enzyme